MAIYENLGFPVSKPGVAQSQAFSFSFQRLFSMTWSFPRITACRDNFPSNFPFPDLLQKVKCTDIAILAALMLSSLSFLHLRSFGRFCVRPSLKRPPLDFSYPRVCKRWFPNGGSSFVEEQHSANPLVTSIIPLRDRGYPTTVWKSRFTDSWLMLPSLFSPRLSTKMLSTDSSLGNESSAQSFSDRSFGRSLGVVDRVITCLFFQDFDGPARSLGWDIRANDPGSPRDIWPEDFLFGLIFRS